MEKQKQEDKIEENEVKRKFVYEFGIPEKCAFCCDRMNKIIMKRIEEEFTLRDLTSRLPFYPKAKIGDLDGAITNTKLNIEDMEKQIKMWRQIYEELKDSRLTI